MRYSDIYVWGMRICIKITFTIDVTPCNLVEAHLRSAFIFDRDDEGYYHKIYIFWDIRTCNPYSFHDDFLLGLFFDHENGSDMFLRNLC